MADHNLPFPTAEEGALVTVLLIVDDVARSRDFYADVLGGKSSGRKPPRLSSSTTPGLSSIREAVAPLTSPT